MRADLTAQFPCVADTTRPAQASVAAKHDERGKALLPRLLRVAQAEVERVLGRQERNDQLPGHVGTEVRDEMPKIVLLLLPDGAVGEKDGDVLFRQRTHRVVRVNPGVHAFERPELRTRRPEFRRDHGSCGLQCFQE